MTNHKYCLSIAVLAMVLTASSPAAADGVLLESYGGERPHDADSLLAPLRDELASRQYLTGVVLGERIKVRVSEPATKLTEAKLAEASRFIESGFEQHLKGTWRLAIADLSRGIETLLSAPASMVQQQEYRDLLRKGLMGLARSHNELGNTREARRAISEVLRTFPKQELSRAGYPPSVHQLYREVAMEAGQRGLGHLNVHTDKGVMVFVNERFVGLGEVELRDMVPGLYRVYLQEGERRGRLHQFRVKPGANTALAIHWRLDGTLRSSNDFVGFEFEDDDQRGEFEAINAVEVGRAVNAESLAVVGIRVHNDRRSIIGVVYSMETGKVVRSATLAIDPIPPSAEKVRALGRFLGGDEAAAKMFREPAIAPPQRGPGRDHPQWYADKLGWTLAAGGFVTAAVGGGFLVSASGLEDQASSEPDQAERDRLEKKADDRRTVGTVLTLAGAAILTAGVVKLVIHPRSKPTSRSSTMVGFGLGSVVVQGRF